MNSGFVFLSSYYQALRPIPDAERLALLDAILDFAFVGIEPKDLPPLLKGYFALLRPNIESSLRRYSAATTNGKTGGRPPKKQSETESKPNQNPIKTQLEPNRKLDKDKDMDTDTEKDSERDKGGADKPPTRPRFVPPTVEQVAEYVKQRGSKVDPQGFADFYEARGWMIGKTPMKDWKAACRNAEHWERWDKAGQPAPQQSGSGNIFADMARERGIF